MDTKQIEQVKGYLKVIKDFDIDKSISTFYSSFGDLSAIKIGNYNVLELSRTLKDVIENFNYAFENHSHQFLPFQYNFQNEFGAGSLTTDLTTISNQLLVKQFQNIPPYLDRLVYYQISHSIWNIPKTRRVSKTESKKLFQELTLIQKHLKEQSGVLNNLMNEAKSKIKDLESFKQQKIKELQEINNNLQLSRNQANEMTNLLQKSTSTNEKISSIFSQSDQKLQEINKKHEAEEKLFKEQSQIIINHVDNLNSLSQKFQKQNSDFENKLNFVESKKGFFEERIKYLEELIGREVGASLFETFRQRKNELKKPVNFWKWAVPAMSVATVVWIFIIFKGHTELAQMSIWWKLFAINTLKSIPAIFLLIFSIAQYKKERNFQEEYAFKSAVALTIDAFSKRISNEQNKDELILKSVLEVYRTPMYFTKDEKDDQPTRQVYDNIKNITGTVKEVIKN